MLFRLMVLLASPVFGQETPLFTKDFPPEEFAARRAAVYDAIGRGAIALLQGAPSPSGYVRFRQTNEFYYLCGIEVPHAYLLLDGGTRRTTVFLPHKNARRESGEGKALSADDGDVKGLSGVEEVAGIDLLAETLTRYMRRDIPKMLTPFQPSEGTATSRDLALRTVADAASDPWDGRPSREGRFLELLRTRFPQFVIEDLSPVLDRLRVVKSAREISMIKRATRISGMALLEGMRSTKPGVTEFELDGMAKFVYYRNGAQGEAYYSLIASGRNAWYPHYNAGKRKMDGGDFLLMDFAPDVGYYMSDVTRMWPVNGKFSDWQRELYGFYLGCYEAILKNIRPNVKVTAIQEAAHREMEALLGKTKFSKPEYERAAKTFVGMMGRRSGTLGHWVGMATHDVGPVVEMLKPGMVFTIEPALTVAEEKIYIRLEDLIVVTESGAEVVSDFVPRAMEAIERVMKEPGMLQRYPMAE